MQISFLKILPENALKFVSKKMRICVKNFAQLQKGKHIFGMVKVGEKGQIVIPAKARKIFDIKPGDNLIVLGDERQGIALIKEKGLLDLLKAAREEH